MLIQNRRRFLAGITAAGAAGFAGAPPPLAAEPPPETTRVRIPGGLGACTAPLYLAEALLRQEGFADIQYVAATGPGMVADDAVDFDMLAAVDYLPFLDAGKSLKVLAGIHVGCFELRANDSVKSVADLRGKKVGVSAPLGISADHLLVSVMAAYVGLKPAADIEWIADPQVSQAELFAAGKIDAFVGFPPDPAKPCARHLGHVVVNTANDRPWSNYYCCMLAANAGFARDNPVATKRALRAFLKATDICQADPERAVSRMVAAGYSADCAAMILGDARYGLWREYDPEDTVRFFTLRLHEAGLIRKTPNEIIAAHTDWRYLEEVRRELKT